MTIRPVNRGSTSLLHQFGVQEFARLRKELRRRCFYGFINPYKVEERVVFRYILLLRSFHHMRVRTTVIIKLIRSQHRQLSGEQATCHYNGRKEVEESHALGNSVLLVANATWKRNWQTDRQTDEQLTLVINCSRLAEFDNTRRYNMSAGNRWKCSVPPCRPIRCRTSVSVCWK